MAGVAPRDADPVQRRDRIHAGFAFDRRYGEGDVSFRLWPAREQRFALRVLGRSGLVAERCPNRLHPDQAAGRRADDSDDFPGIRPRTPRRLPPICNLRGDRCSCRARALLLAVPRRRTGGISCRDARVPVDRARRGDPNALVDRPRARILLPRRPRPNAARGLVRSAGTRAACSALAHRAHTPVAGDLVTGRLGRLRSAPDRCRGRPFGGDRSPVVHVVPRHRLSEGADARVRNLGRRRAGDRDRDRAAARRARRPRPPARRAP